MNTNFLKTTLGFCIALCTIMILSTTVLAQDQADADDSVYVKKFFMPLVQTPKPIDRPIQQSDCVSLGNAYTLSSWYWKDGTSFRRILEDLHYHPQDFAVNYRFYPNGVIDSKQGRSRVCVLRTYFATWHLGKKTIGENYVTTWPSGRPDWNVIASPVLNRSAEDVEHYTISDANDLKRLYQEMPSASDVYALMSVPYTNTQDSGWMGAVYVGTMEYADSAIKHVVRIPGASAAAKLLTRGLSVALPLWTLYEAIDTASTKGLPVPASMLSSKVSMFYVSQIPASGMVYVACSANIIALQAGYKVGELIQFTTESQSGTSSPGCLLSAIPVGGSGAFSVSYPWRVAQQGIIETALALKSSAEEAKEIIAELEEFYEQKERKVPLSPADEQRVACPSIIHEVHWFVAVSTAIAHADYMVAHYGTKYNEAEIAHALDVAITARDNIEPGQMLTSWYKDRHPRGNGAEAHAASDYHDIENYLWKLQLQCYWIVGPFVLRPRYVWYNNIDYCTTKSGICRSDEVLPYVREPNFLPTNYPYQYYD